jgi:hypothetical protein
MAAKAQQLLQNFYENKIINYFQNANNLQAMKE